MNLPDMLDPYDVTYRLVDGWAGRGRPATFTPVGVMVHHTAGTNSLAVVRDGRSDLPGPLAHMLIDKGGIVHVVAAGYCNHAGPGTLDVLYRTRGDVAPAGDARSLGLPDTTYGNRWYYGIEVENLGTPDDPYPHAQLDALARTCAALCAAHGWTANRVVHHREWTRRKPDMSYRGPLRDTVRALIATKEDTMERIAAILRTKTVSWYQRLIDLTGVPGGANAADYWGVDGSGKPTDKEYLDAAPVILAAVFDAALMPGSGGITIGDSVTISGRIT